MTIIKQCDDIIKQVNETKCGFVEPTDILSLVEDLAYVVKELAEKIEETE
jgi:hypothetical protein